MLSPDKEVRGEIAVLRNLDFDFAGSTSNHLCFDHEKHGRIVMARTPSDRRWRKNHRAQLARVMGISTWELKQLAAGRSTERRPNLRVVGPGRRDHETIVMEHAMSLGIPCDRTIARRLLNRFDGVRGARVALNGMVEQLGHQQAA